MTIDEPLLTRVDRAIQKMHTTRSEFIREAVKSALERQRIQELEEQHEAGYRRIPMTEEEVQGWRGVQAWGDE